MAAAEGRILEIFHLLLDLSFALRYGGRWASADGDRLIAWGSTRQPCLEREGRV